jgi:hypothetical protein
MIADAQLLSSVSSSIIGLAPVRRGARPRGLSDRQRPSTPGFRSNPPQRFRVTVRGPLFAGGPLNRHIAGARF